MGMDDFESVEKRYCKKCGKELTSTNQTGFCDNCRLKRKKKTVNGLKGVISLIAFGAYVVLSKGDMIKHDSGDQA